jgi:sulfite reductase (ferredoxin)
VYADRVHLDDLTPLLTPLLQAWRDEREHGESFGGWCDRLGPRTLHERFPARPEVGV